MSKIITIELNGVKTEYNSWSEIQKALSLGETPMSGDTVTKKLIKAGYKLVSVVDDGSTAPRKSSGKKPADVDILAVIRQRLAVVDTAKIKAMTDEMVQLTFNSKTQKEFEKIKAMANEIQALSNPVVTSEAILKYVEKLLLNEVVETPEATE
jgi:phosphoribosylformylglycinamidine (FGAM) synthase PurS component